MSEVIEAIQLWRRGGEEANIELVTRALSEDVQLISPITDQFRFVGMRQIRLLLEVALGAVQENRYTDEISDKKRFPLSKTTCSFRTVSKLMPS